MDLSINFKIGFNFQVFRNWRRTFIREIQVSTALSGSADGWYAAIQCVFTMTPRTWIWADVINRDGRGRGGNIDTTYQYKLATLWRFCFHVL